VLDGDYRRGTEGEPVFVDVAAPTDEALDQRYGAALRVVCLQACLREQQAIEHAVHDLRHGVSKPHRHPRLIL
jgi:hypothetical protein